MKNAAAARDATLVASLTVIAVTAFATNGAAVSEAIWIPAPNVARMTAPMIDAAKSAILLPAPRFMPMKAAPVPAPRIREAI